MLEQFPIKVVWLFSTESWGIQRLSKHYYALELCNYADEVYFFNPFQYSIHSTIDITTSKENAKLKIVSCGFFKKGQRFIPGSLSYLIFKFKVNWIKSKIGKSPNAVFSFNYIDIISFKPFDAQYNVFLQYDALIKQTRLPNIGYTADLLVTVTKNILNFFKQYEKPALLLQHGLNNDFESYAILQLKKTHINKEKGIPSNALFVGSLFKATLDRNSFKGIIMKNPSITFHFFGAYVAKNNNLGGIENEEIFQFIEFLQTTSNVKLYGPKLSFEIVNNLPFMDCCLHLEKNLADTVDITNSHKLIEYLATGKPIFTTNVESYESLKSLLYITHSDVVASFGEFVINISQGVDNDQSQKRIEYALDHTYKKNTQKIIHHLIELA